MTRSEAFSVVVFASLMETAPLSAQAAAVDRQRVKAEFFAAEHAHSAMKRTAAFMKGNRHT
ncbi:MAG: hypothetical protein HYY84_19225 [Deltaproteobacteria bacterium]|nr:hypothetical protein [Deltaproteobacteria bacterium]